MSQSPSLAPSYSLYRNVSANDTLPVTDGKQAMNMSGYKTANVQVVPKDGANPTIDVLYWSEEAGEFVQENTAITKTGVGADTAHEFSFDSNGRKIFLAVSSLSAGSVKLFVSGFGLQHPE